MALINNKVRQLNLLKIFAGVIAGTTPIYYSLFYTEAEVTKKVEDLQLDDLLNLDASPVSFTLNKDNVYYAIKQEDLIDDTYINNLTEIEILGANYYITRDIANFGDNFWTCIYINENITPGGTYGEPLNYTHATIYVSVDLYGGIVDPINILTEGFKYPTYRTLTKGESFSLTTLIRF